MRLFISHSHVDKANIEPLVGLLKEQDFQVWFDQGLVVGKDWKEQLSEAIRQSDAFVYVLTPESLKSEWCQWELSLAIKTGKPIIPVQLQNKINLPTKLKFLESAPWINLTHELNRNSKFIDNIEQATSFPASFMIQAHTPTGLPAQDISMGQYNINKTSKMFISGLMIGLIILTALWALSSLKMHTGLLEGLGLLISAISFYAAKELR